MAFFKKNWIAIIIVLGLGAALWIQYNKTKKAEAALKAAGGDPLGGGAGYIQGLPEYKGYDGSGIAGNVID